MAQPKKGTLHQLFATMVDSTDFASVESGITASDFNSGVTAKFYGMNTGGSGATTSGTVSKAASLVRSGVFRITLKATENNYDKMQLRLNKTGCAEQIYEWENVDNDDSDIRSALTSIENSISDFRSVTATAANLASHVWSNAIGAAVSSRVLLTLSHVSDIASNLSDLKSDFQSRVPKRVATDSQLSDMSSDIKSAVAALTVTLSASDISDIASAVIAGTGAASSGNTTQTP